MISMLPDKASPSLSVAADDVAVCGLSAKF
jgi:hypothetical protein